MMIGVAGGTGTVGRPTVEAVKAQGHEAVVLSRSTGVDLVTGEGLDAALSGVDAVIDTSNVETLSEEKATAFFTAAGRNLLAAAQRHGVRHVVLLSIVGVDRAPYGYYAAKLAQEDLVGRSVVPWTILRATQFHEFAAQMFDRAGFGPLHIAPRARVQPVAAAEVGARLAEIAAGAAVGRAADFAGPRQERLEDMVRGYARRAGYRGWVPAMNVPGALMRSMRAGSVLPGPDALLGTQTFEQWLSSRR